MKKVIVLRHGYRSDATALMRLADYLYRRVDADIDNESYDWTKSVIHNGIHLAEELQKKFPSRLVVLVGHSMGGLVCRVANIALACDNLAPVMASHGKTWDYPPEDIDLAEKFGRRAAIAQPPEVRAVITLATPNSGAMTKAQTASLLNLGALWHGVTPGAVLGAAKALGGLTSAYYNARYQSTRDLTSIRVFRMFQHFQVRNRCLSISGSSINTLAGGSLLAKSIKFAGVTLGLPNDEIVEDRSVDLNQSVLPHEFDPQLYTHLRGYEDCAFVDHFNIYDMQVVREHVVRFVEGL
jgi:triacylglycerol esterase/lipase EstA (alpha/beta hydrolase family)